MDPDYLLEKINQSRSATLRLTTNGGQEYLLPPGTTAYIDATDTIYVMWPPTDPGEPFRVGRAVMLGAVNICAAESVERQAG